jgi:Uma2 family endonuclease
MSVLTLPKPKQPITLASSPARKRWTVAEFHELWENGWFDHCKPMLVDGEIYEMAIPGPLHNRDVGLADYRLRAIFEDGYWVRIQMPLVLGQESDPVPDIAVVVGSPQSLVDQPTTAILIVEVADTSVQIDLGEKAIAYAAAGITDYWVVDLNNRQIVVHRSPSGSKYSSVTRLSVQQTVAPLAAPSATITVSELIPQ